MIRKFLIVVSFLIISSLINAQPISKEIHGDTIIRYQTGLIKELGLKDFLLVQDNFNFRFWDQGKIVELTKTDSILSGQIINFIYWTHKSKSKTVHQNIILDNKSCLNLFDIISKSTIYSLPTDRSISGWLHGSDGITYGFEYADKYNYTFKTYWTPGVQDSLREALEISDLVHQIADTLKLSEKYASFKASLPAKGCYTSGGMMVSCFMSNSFGIGYSGSINLPVGYSLSLNLVQIGNVQTSIGLYVNHQIDNNSQYKFSFGINKQYLFIHKQDRGDILSYNFNKVRIKKISDRYIRNQIVSYGIPLKNNFTIGTGLNYLNSDHNYLGGLLFISRWFPKPLLTINTMITYISDQIDYKLGLSKYFILKKISSTSVWSLSLFNEKLLNYNDLYLSVGINF
jgi:hypothetical protein